MPVQDFDGDAAREKAVGDDEFFEEIAAEAVGFLDGERVTVVEAAEAAVRPGRRWAAETVIPSRTTES
ncbi:hypothetical protein ACH46F_02870 [Streptomyces virginiae]|uniref:hypothetical protein n=1 Tax=Streptomyces virginiae TaxID=1961 RepID=UPI00378B788A